MDCTEKCPKSANIASAPETTYKQVVASNRYLFYNTTWQTQRWNRKGWLSFSLWSKTDASISLCTLQLLSPNLIWNNQYSSPKKTPNLLYQHIFALPRPLNFYIISNIKETMCYKRYKRGKQATDQNILLSKEAMRTVKNKMKWTGSPKCLYQEQTWYQYLSACLFIQWLIGICVPKQTI